MDIVFCGGGTGGHVMPLIAISRELRRLYTKEDLTLHYIGPNNEEGLFLLNQENFISHAIATGKLRRYFSFQNIWDVLFNIPAGFLQSFFLLLSIKPKLVFSKGGTSSLPITFSAKLLNIPVFIHESDITPGLSNRATSPWATKIFTSFEKTEYFDLAKTMLVGNPIKKELLEGDNQGAMETLGITFEKPVIMFYGGSQGSKPINDFVLEILDKLLEKYEIIHVCGKNNFSDVKVESELIVNKEVEPYYHAFASLSEVQLKHAYKAASLIVARAGAGSIFEIAAAGKPSILIPLPTAAGDHQSKNAYDYAKNGAAIIVEQENLTPNFFISEINNVISNPKKTQYMQDAAFRFSKPLAARAIAREMLEFLHANQN